MSPKTNNNSEAREAALYRRVRALREALDALTTYVGRTPNGVDERGTMNDRAVYDAYCAAARALHDDDREDTAEPNGWRDLGSAPLNELVLLFCPAASCVYDRRIGSLVGDDRASAHWYSQAETLADAERLSPVAWQRLSAGTASLANATTTKELPDRRAA